LRQNNEMSWGKVVVCKIAWRPRPPNRGSKGTYAGSQGVVCKMAEPATQVAALLQGTIALNRVRVVGAVRAPIVGMAGAPLPRTIAADLTILRILLELVLTVLGATLALADGLATNHLLRMRSRRHEELMTERATSLHSSRPMTHCAAECMVKSRLEEITSTSRAIDSQLAG